MTELGGDNPTPTSDDGRVTFGETEWFVNPNSWPSLACRFGGV